MMVTNLLEQSGEQTPLASSGCEQQRGSKTCSRFFFWGGVALFVAELVTFSDRRTVTLLSSGYIL